jgi:predicted SnoaL-like aldol condensation-catalyzing enzyme
VIEVFKQMIKAMENTTRLDFGSDSYRQFNAAIQSGKQAIAELESQERNFCSRCGKRTPDLTTIHTCTPPQD